MTARIKGDKLTITIDGVELHDDGTSVEMDNEEANGDVTTFADALAGGARQHFLALSATQGTHPSSFWRLCWANTGAEVAFIFRPHGNAVASSSEPHFTGTCKIGPKPKLGGGAGDTFTFDTRFDIIGEPVMDAGASSVPLITSVDDDTVADLDLVRVYGSRFTGTTGVTVDGTAAKFTVVSDGILVVEVPVAAGGPADIIVTNAAGPSAAFPITVA